LNNVDVAQFCVNCQREGASPRLTPLFTEPGSQNCEPVKRLNHSAQDWTLCFICSFTGMWQC